MSDAILNRVKLHLQRVPLLPKIEKTKEEKNRRNKAKRLRKKYK